MSEDRRLPVQVDVDPLLLTKDWDTLLSDVFLSVIPFDPNWLPNSTVENIAVEILKEMCPNAGGDVEVLRHEAPAFVNSGPDLENVSCPACGTDLDFQGWWIPSMDELYDRGGFSKLEVRTPCCDTETTLNDLVYEEACGFARFQLKLLNPNVRRLTEEDLASLGRTLGRPVRQVWLRV